MEKMILADRTELDIRPGSSLGENRVMVENFAGLDAVAAALTKEGNLKTVQYQNGEKVTGLYHDMKLETPIFKAVDYYEDTNKVIAVFGIREKTEIEKRLDTIEENQRKFELGQQTQDGAILDLAGIVGGQA